jgi:hypothetical protein
MSPATAPEDGNRTPGRAGSDPAGLARMLSGWFAVILGACVVLLLLDRLPGLLSGLPRGVLPVGTVEDAERTLHARLLLPAYFPDTLRWPPVAVDIYFGPPAAAAVAFAGRTGPVVRLMVCQTIEPAGSVPVKLLPPGLILESARTRVGNDPGTLTRLQLDDGRVVNELTWHRADRLFALRFDGPVEQLMTLAQSVNADRL